ncbi:phage tail protein [Desulfovibrio inopinatus]|uniref:phage tail protein n=1 Tax=Desulfovibrio inopinatus TaxID=102109 RepID=UPI00041A02B5|nr:phage tail protein [Desulfovibrio inopinatus]
MGYWFIAVYVVSMIASVLASEYSKTQTATPSSPLPKSVTDFTVSNTKQGTPIPYVCGWGQVAGIMAWYGKQVVLPYTQSTGGGSKIFGGSSSAVAGWVYYIDLEIVLASGKHGDVHIHSYLVNSKNIGFTSQFLADQYAMGVWEFGGSDNTVPAPYVPNSCPKHGLAVNFLFNVSCGSDTRVPSISYYVYRWPTDMPFPCTVELTSGANPAAAMYDGLRMAGCPVELVDVDSFEVASTLYAQRDWGCNIVLDREVDAGSYLAELSDVYNSFLAWTDEGKFALRLDMDTTTDVKASIIDDFSQFSLSPRDDATMYTDWTATFVDVEQAFSEESISVPDPSTRNMVGGTRRAITVDLSTVPTAEAAADILSVKYCKSVRASRTLQCTTSLRFWDVRPGDVIYIECSMHDVKGFFSVSEVQLPSLLDEHPGVQMTAESILIRSMDQGSGTLNLPESVGPLVPKPESGFVRPSMEVEPFEHIHVVELDYDTTYGDGPAVAVCCQRVTQTETGIRVYVSTDGGLSWPGVHTLSSFCQRATLAEDYPAATHPLDKTRGMLVTPDEDADWSQVANIGEAEVWTSGRAVLAGDEILRFRDWTDEGEDVRLNGVVRGTSWTTPTAHPETLEVWICPDLPACTIALGNTATTTIKCVPITVTGQDGHDLSQAVAITLTPTLRALRPLSVAHIQASRSGDNIAVRVYPISKRGYGAGAFGAGSRADDETPVFEGRIEYRINGGTVVQLPDNTRDFTITNSAPCLIECRHQYAGYVSAWKSVEV